MATVFDGRLFAAKKEANLGIRVLGLKARGVYPKLASIIIGKNPASELYVNLKKKAAERIGAEVDIYFLGENSKIDDILLLIDTLNTDEGVNGIMVQLPLPGSIAKFKDQIIGSIKQKKDVDGLRDGSQFLHPTAKAVMDILHEAEDILRLPSRVSPCKVAVVGSTGMVGAPLVKELKEEKYNVIEVNAETHDLAKKVKSADVLISATGVPSLIKSEMVKPGAIVIDVGSPKGDVEAEVSKKAAFVTPVPGGVGPVTISCLLENLIEAC